MWALLSWRSFPIFRTNWLELLETVLAYLVTVLAREELLIGGDDEAEGTLDHVLDHARLHHAVAILPRCSPLSTSA